MPYNAETVKKKEKFKLKLTEIDLIKLIYKTYPYKIYDIQHHI